MRPIARASAPGVTFFFFLLRDSFCLVLWLLTSIRRLSRRRKFLPTSRNKLVFRGTTSAGNHQTAF
ncbi:MAG: hypothetical protein DMG54_13775 [Acidobacteria bacterium]|nr:MAG: hypothetical protein DMG53_18840 [Acidobacteriota bacterium]PYU43216.1 MAG: hypothetical protein DMG54_13775 [Acidobacteriota bacterium]PYU62980.1 MAG: hypothetical protein DMG55_01855 [Acidobacteriota bacterium]PYU74056.1 MAG: hypothetical protein DMG52_12845 [Acidobacteriota bacterium]